MMNKKILSFLRIGPLLEFSLVLLFNKEMIRDMHVVVNDSYEEYDAIGDTSHCDEDINDIQNVNHNIDAFDIVPNASADLGCQEDQFVPFGNPKDYEQIEGTACNKFGSATNTKGIPQFFLFVDKGRMQHI